MLNRLRSKITEFINSEEGKVGVKTSLSLGLVGGGLLLMQSMFPTSAKASIDCWSDSDCASDEQCIFWQDKCTGYYHSKCYDA